MNRLAVDRTDGPGAMTGRPGIRLRAAVADDARLLFDWVNRPETLANKLRTRGPIGWDDHVSWLGNKLARDDVLIRIIEDPTGPVGQVRLERRDGAFEIDVFVLPDRRGRQVARRALSGVLAEAAGRWPDGMALARILQDNTASLALFRACGFRPADSTDDHHVMSRPLAAPGEPE